MYSRSSYTFRISSFFREKEKHIENRFLAISFTSSKAYKKIMNKIKKISTYTQEVCTEFIMIKKILEK